MDLEVYQKALEANVFVCNTLAPSFYKNRNIGAKKNKKEETDEIREIIIKTLSNCACIIPHLIAEAHSCRFGSQTTCLALLERVMLNCNKMIVYVEQARDICQILLEREQYDELIKKYMHIRRKVLNLQRSWKKYMYPAADRSVSEIDAGR